MTSEEGANVLPLFVRIFLLQGDVNTTSVDLNCERKRKKMVVKYSRLLKFTFCNQRARIVQLIYLVMQRWDGEVL